MRRWPIRGPRGRGDRHPAPCVARAPAAGRGAQGRGGGHRTELRELLATKVARWWLPDDVLFVAELPHTATGKLLKTRLREMFKDYRLP